MSEKSLIEQLSLDIHNGTDMKRLAFLNGAKWWEYHATKGTMWQSDQKLAWDEACRKYPVENVESQNDTNETAEADLVYQIWQLVSGNGSSYMVEMEPKAAALIKAFIARPQ